MSRLLVRRLARREIDSAFDWYAERSPAAAKRFLEEIDEAIANISRAPEQHAVVRGRLRRVLLSSFPYAVYYKVFPHVISVVGVIHGHRHPDSWLRRAKP